MLAELLRETAQQHDHYEKTHAKHDWWDLVRALSQRSPAWKHAGRGSHCRGRLYGEARKCSALTSHIAAEGFLYAT